MIMGETRTKLNRMRQYIGGALLESITTIPQAHGFTSVDCTAMLAFQEKAAAEGRKISTSVYLLKCIAQALEEFPQLNSRLEGDEIITYDEINGGVGVDMNGNLAVVVVKNLQGKSIYQIADDFKVLTDKIKNKKLTMDDISGGTFTISNLSKRKRYGAFNSIINNKESFILGMAGIVKMPWVDENDQIVIKPRSNITMNINHTIMDGATSGKFSELIFTLFENPDLFR